MYRTFGFTFAKPQFAVLFVVVVIAFVWGYHRVIQNSIRKHPEATLQAVHDHCRFLLGKRLGKMPNDDLANEFQRCNDIQVRSVEAGGGVFDPIIVKITVEAQTVIPLDPPVLIFKTSDISPRSLNFLSGLSSLLSGRWAFNFFNTYSETTFHGSF